MAERAAYTGPVFTGRWGTINQSPPPPASRGLVFFQGLHREVSLASENAS